MLEVAGLDAWYGEAQALRDVNLRAGPGEVVTLVGRNGAGKTTALRCVMGLHRAMRGSVRLGDTDLAALGPVRRARAGIGYVPDDRGIYATLTVQEHLILPAKAADSAWDLDRVYAAFPALRDRRGQSASKLSGGEQQMLAIARVLRMGARLLLLDEPTEGLAPILVQQIAAILRDAKAEGRAVLLVEQNLRFATAVADRHYLLSHGTIVATLGNDEVRTRESELLQHLGI
ncbi:MAG TPA: ABC transporter ATP-binding protein [Candidatus Limnocylindria bacterium]|nr:ABC transporter ATP-binding protein [Candidatus Limnocylindria bacterium]